MPLVGTRPTADFEHGPLLRQPGGEPWVLPRALILQVMYEIEQGAMTSLLPPALHPTIPPTLVVTVMRAPESPVGPFTLAEAKVGCRSGARPRALSVRDDPSPQRIQSFLIRDALHLHKIGFGMLITRMRNAMQEPAVVAQQKQSFTVIIEPPGRVNPRDIHIVGERRTPLRICKTAQDAIRLVKHDIAAGAQRNGTPIHGQCVAQGIRARVGIHDRPAVHRHAPLDDELQALRRRAHARKR